MAKPTYFNCRYRKCRKALSDAKVRRHAEYCNRIHREAEYKLQKEDAKNALKTKRQIAFDRYFKKHPQVWNELKGEVSMRYCRGDREFSVKDYFFALKFSYGLRMDNTFMSYYARMLVEQHPRYSAIIKTRKK